MEVDIAAAATETDTRFEGRPVDPFIDPDEAAATAFPVDTIDALSCSCSSPDSPIAISISLS
jgi:hypothetical protein